MNDHSECVSYEILRREAQETLDPSDPAYDMYKKKPTKVVKDKHVSEKEEKKPKRERLIINPEFVESLDQGDGSVQYDEDYTIDENEVWKSSVENYSHDFSSSSKSVGALI